MIFKATLDIGKLLPITSRRLMRFIVAKTPIDTGKARAHWEFSRSGGSPDNKYTMINNPLDYIERLDNGWSKQAPHGFTIIAARNWGNIVDESVKDWLQ